MSRMGNVHSASLPSHLGAASANAHDSVVLSSSSNKHQRPTSPPVSVSSQVSVAPRAPSPKKKKAKRMATPSQPSVDTKASLDWSASDVTVLLEALLGFEGDNYFDQLEKSAIPMFKKVFIYMMFY